MTKYWATLSCVPIPLLLAKSENIFGLRGESISAVSDYNVPLRSRLTTDKIPAVKKKTAKPTVSLFACRRKIGKLQYFQTI